VLLLAELAITVLLLPLTGAGFVDLLSARLTRLAGFCASHAAKFLLTPLLGVRSEVKVECEVEGVVVAELGLWAWFA
jgi:hypothetical protein